MIPEKIIETMRWSLECALRETVNDDSEALDDIHRRLDLVTECYDFLDNLPKPPKPNWSQAPEWATLWMVSPWGDVLWAEREPTEDEFDHMLNGYEFTGLRYMWAGKTNIPFRIDWRALKYRRFRLK